MVCHRGRKVVGVHDHLQVDVSGLASAGVLVLAQWYAMSDVSLSPAALLQWLRSELDSFHAVRHQSAELEAKQFLLQAKVRQRYSDNEVCSLYYIRAAIFSVGTLPFSIGNVRLIRET